MGAMASQITILTIVYSTVYSGADQGKPVNSTHKWPVTFDDVIMFFVTYTDSIHGVSDVIQVAYLCEKHPEIVTNDLNRRGE